MGDKPKSAFTIALEKIAFYLDAIFALVLWALAGIRIWQGYYTSAAAIVLLGYYIFFGLILMLSLCLHKWIYVYLGFLNSDFFKALFYIFLATLIFADTYWVNLIAGVVMGAASIFNLFRFFQRIARGES